MITRLRAVGSEPVRGGRMRSSPRYRQWSSRLRRCRPGCYGRDGEASTVVSRSVMVAIRMECAVWWFVVEAMTRNTIT